MKKTVVQWGVESLSHDALREGWSTWTGWHDTRDEALTTVAHFGYAFDPRHLRIVKKTTTTTYEYFPFSNE